MTYHDLQVSSAAPGPGDQTFIPQEELPETAGPSKLVSIPILGGLHHKYARVAA